MIFGLVLYVAGALIFGLVAVLWIDAEPNSTSDYAIEGVFAIAVGSLWLLLFPLFVAGYVVSKVAHRLT